MAFDDLPQEVKDLATAVRSQAGPVIGSAVMTDTRTMDVAKAALLTVHDYAPGAPVELLQEAAVRLSGWMLASNPGMNRKDITDPSGAALALDFGGGMTRNGLRQSGASALLSRYVIRRAGAIG